MIKILILKYSFTLLLLSISITILGQNINNSIELSAHSIKYIEPINDNSDLQFLHNYIANKDIVSLGESTHGSSEVFKLKHRVIKYLIEEEGFNVFAIEANMAESALLNDYIQTGEGNPSELLENLGYWVWNTQEVLDLLIWMKEYNETNTPKIKFTGFDMQSYRAALKNIKELSPPNNKELEISTHTLDSIDNEILSNQQKGIYQLSDTLKEQMYIESNTLYSAITILDKNVKNFDWLLQNSKLLLQYATRYSKHKPENGYRDLCMAKNLKWIKDNNQDSKVIIWAHNGHVKRAEYTMGDYMLKSKLNPYVLGFSIYQGKYTAIANGEFAQNELSIPNKTNYEFYFNEISIPTYFVDVKELINNNCKFISEKLTFREIGSMKRDEQFYDAELTKEYDGIINIKETSCTKLLYKY